MSMDRSLRSAVSHNIIVRLVLYYALLAAALAGAFRVLPAGARTTVRATLASLSGAATQGSASGDLFSTTVTRNPAFAPAPLVVGAAVLIAFMLAVPVAWTYMWTRRTKGYSQSVVHSLILLPVVVAGVVVLVQSSLALAFSLAGIVAAVRFRNTLDDSKDAVFIFFATALGLATAVQVDAAVVLSVLFIAVVLTLWYSDFARMPPGLEDARAQRQLERAVAIANRTSEFVARVDREVLQAMAPAQLDALAERVRRRRSESDADGEGASTGGDCVLRVAVSDVEAARPPIEAALERHCKRWTVATGPRDGDGLVTLEYTVSIRKRSSIAELVFAIEKDARPHVARVERVATVAS